MSLVAKVSRVLVGVDHDEGAVHVVSKKVLFVPSTEGIVERTSS